MVIINLIKNIKIYIEYEETKSRLFGSPVHRYAVRFVDTDKKLRGCMKVEEEDYSKETMGSEGFKQTILYLMARNYATWKDCPSYSELTSRGIMPHHPRADKEYAKIRGLFGEALSKMFTEEEAEKLLPSREKVMKVRENDGVRVN